MEDKIYLLTSGEEKHGRGLSVIGVHRTRQGAQAAKDIYESPVVLHDGTSFNFNAQIEEWRVEE